MSRHFLCNTRLAGIEQMMLLPPNFSPRSSGFQISGILHDIDGRYYTTAPKVDCVVDYYSSIREQLKATFNYGNWVAECFAHIKNPRTKARFYLAAADYRWLYRDYQHMERLVSVWQLFIDDVARKPPTFAAALHLLTADAELWKAAEEAVKEFDIDLTKVKLRGISMDNYILYQTAKSIYTGEKRIMAADLADESIVSDELLKIIMGAMLIDRLGWGVYSVLG